MIRAATATAAVCLVACPAALAHGGAGSGYRSTVTRVAPAGLVTVQVVQGDDELKLRNPGAHRVVVLGYDGEPYLLFAGGRVFRNKRSPAAYLNQDRYADVKVPPVADAKAPPQWVPLASAPVYQWHDHRIHWMSPIPPPTVKRAKAEPHHIFDWKVPGTVDGRPLLISGSLDWIAVEDDSFPVWLLGLLVAGAVAATAGGALWWRRRRRATS